MCGEIHEKRGDYPCRVCGKSEWKVTSMIKYSDETPLMWFPPIKLECPCGYIADLEWVPKPGV